MTSSRHLMTGGFARARTIGLVVSLAIGALLLGLTFRREYVDPVFYLLSALLALVWMFAWFCGEPKKDSRVSRDDLRINGVLRNTILLAFGVLTGAGLVALFAALMIVVRNMPVLGDSIRAVIGPIDSRVYVPVLLTAVAVGACEELAFRGAVYDRLRRAPILGSTALYALVTTATGHLALVGAAIALGLVAGLLRERTGSIIPSLVTHVVWSLGMLVLLPGLV